MFYGVDKINAFALAMLDQAELDDLLWSIAQSVGDVMHFNDCVIYLRDDDKLIQMAAFGIKNPKDREIYERIEIPVGQGIVGTVAATGIAENVTDTRKDPRYINDQFNGLSELAVPVIYEGKTIAVIDTESDKPNDYSEFDQALLQVIANIASPRIASAQYQQKLKRTQARLTQSNAKLSKSLNDLAVNQAALIASEKMATVGVLAAGVAHEINTPLGYSISNLNMLKEYLADIERSFESLKAIPNLPSEAATIASDPELAYIISDANELTKQTLKGLVTAKNIMQDLKGFSRESVNTFTLSDVNQGIHATLNILRNELKDNCEVVLELANIPHIYANMGKLNQVFMNLIMNAKQAITEHGKITIRTEAQQNGVLIKVSDNGCGIDESHLKDIFTPFFTTKPLGEGTGLGLAICYRIICDEHHGEITVESNTNGTTFCIFLPSNQNALLHQA